MAEAVKLVTGKTDAELAADIKRRLLEASGPVLEILDEAKANGLEVNIAWGPGPLGKIAVTNLVVFKTF